MVEIQSMVPIAAVVDLVLGVATLSILARSPGTSANNRIVGCILGWILVFLGLSYIMTSVLEFRYGALADFSAVNREKVGGTFAFTAKNLLISASYMLMALLPFFFPFRLINRDWDLWFLLAGVCITTGVLTAIHLMTDFKHFQVENFLFIPGYVVLISMYLRFVVTEVRDNDERLRKISVVVGLLLIGIHGETMTYWLSQVLSINDLFFQRQSIQNGLSISGAAWGGMSVRLTLGATAMLVLFAGESWRSFKVGL